MNNILKLALCIAIPLAIGSISGIATAGNITGWYATLQKPFFNPPNYLFGPVWTLLYGLMGVSLYLIWNAPSSSMRTNALIIFGVQMLLNFAWSFIFFHFKELGWALVEIILTWLSIFTMIVMFSGINKTAAYIQIPYLCWVTFATILNAAIWKLN